MLHECMLLMVCILLIECSVQWLGRLYAEMNCIQKWNFIIFVDIYLSAQQRVHSVLNFVHIRFVDHMGMNERVHRWNIIILLLYINTSRKSTKMVLFLHDFNSFFFSTFCIKMKERNCFFLLLPSHGPWV